MSPRRNRAVAASGLFLLLGVPASWIGILAGMLTTLGGMSGDIAQAAVQIKSGVLVGMWSAIIGQSIALIGLTLLLIAIFALEVREPWVLKWGRRLMFPLLILLPLGTLAGVLMLVYFSRHRDEFTGEPKDLTPKPDVVARF